MSVEVDKPFLWAFMRCTHYTHPALTGRHLLLSLSHTPAQIHVTSRACVLALINRETLDTTDKTNNMNTVQYIIHMSLWETLIAF